MVRGQENKEFWQALLCMMVLYAGIALLFFWLMKVLCFSKGKQGAYYETI